MRADAAAGHAAGLPAAGGRTGAVPADLPPPEHTPAEAREAADAVLARREYRWHDESILDRIGDWVADRLDGALSSVGLDVGGLPTWAGWLVIVAFAALAAVLAWRARGGWRRDPVIGAADRVVVTSGEAAVDWEGEAARCEAEGRWREALRARYRVLVGDLARRGVIGDLAGRTAGELVSDVRRSSPAAAPAFAAATALFEAAWYGGEPVGPAERDRFVRVAGEARAVATPAGQAVPV